jgi:hypothetical protein
MISLDYFNTTASLLRLLRIAGMAAVFILYIIVQNRSRTFGIVGGVVYNSSGQFEGLDASCPASCAVSVPRVWVIDERMRIATLVLLFLAAVMSNETIREELHLDIVWVIWGVVCLLLSLVTFIDGASAVVKMRNLERYPGLTVTPDWGSEATWGFGQ